MGIVIAFRPHEREARRRDGGAPRGAAARPYRIANAHQTSRGRGRRRRVPRALAAALLLLAASRVEAGAQQLTNPAFQIQYDASGIRSLKRTNDVHDTDYIAAGGALGPVLVRFRTTPNGDWQELREMLMEASGRGGTVEYTLGTVRPTLASRSAPSAQVGAGGLRALNDGQVPGAGAAARDAALFTWSGARGGTQWVQYTFPVEEEVSRVEVFWVATAGAPNPAAPPRSWRLLYQDGGAWREVRARGAYGVEANAFNTLEFDPVTTLALRIEASMDRGARVGIAEWQVGPPPAIVPSPDLRVGSRFTLEDDALNWTITLTNTSAGAVEVGDLAVPFEFAERTGARGEIYTRKLLRHAYVAGHGSWAYWQRAGGEGPFLVAIPAGRTKIEYFDGGGGRAGIYTPYIHAGAASVAAAAAGGNWRLPVTRLTLDAGATVTYGFRFRWARDVAAVRDILYEEGKFDINVVPGMVVPSDLEAMFALRGRNDIDAIEAEHPDQTQIDDVDVKPGGIRVYRVRFSRPGENTLTVRYGEGLWTTLQFFVTEPLETLIKKRAAFLVNRHQHTDPDKWYAGAYGDWDQKNEILRGPGDRDGLSTWLTDANDDAGNARPAFIASKNVFFPDAEEIASLELYIDRYLWGGMQMTESERYPYAIYGIPNWKANRASPDAGRNGRAHVWRIYDYPHIVMLYHRMYQIARFYPELSRHLTADEYLQRAYRTAVAYWTVPQEVEGWSADAVGTMNEAFIPELIDTLETEGKPEWASTLRGFWEGKVERFINRTPNLYGSEFAFDSTGFESTGAFAKYAMARVLRPGEDAPADAPDEDFRRRVTHDAALAFTNFQLLLNVSARGWLETTYFQLGSDYRNSTSYLLSYMSQMGGWSILDYGLHLAEDPADYLRLGYASSLSSWALVNSGTEESGWGYWFPSRTNDGAAGGGFMPEPLGRAWIGKTMARGAWYYSAEQDVGYCGALRTHATIVTTDPIFGEFAYGGMMVRDGREVRVIPRDGLRVRFHVIRGDHRFHMTVDRDGTAGRGARRSLQDCVDA